MQIFFPEVSQDSTFTVEFKSPAETVVLNFFVSSSATDEFSVLSPSSLEVSPGITPFSLQIPNDTYSTISSISFISAINSSDITAVDSWTNQTGLSFSVDLYAGTYRLKVNSTKGYFKFNSLVNVSVPENITGSSSVVSYAGGALTLGGNRLSPSSYVTFHGMKGYPLSSNESHVQY